VGLWLIFDANYDRLKVKMDVFKCFDSAMVLPIHYDVVILKKKFENGLDG